MLFGMWQTTNASEVMRITTTNNLLIGTTTDGGFRLSVNGTTNLSNTLTIGPLGASTAGVQITGNDQSNTRIKITNTGGSSFSVVTGNPGASNNGFAIFDETAAATRLYISTAGNLLVGTTTDNGTKLQNNGNFCTGNEIYGFTTSSFLRISGGGSNVGGASVLMFGEASSTTPGRIAVSAVGTQPIEFYGGGALRFSIKSNGTLNCNNMPTSAAGLVTGDIYSNLGVLTIIP
jgi:hypothetical protein